MKKFLSKLGSIPNYFPHILLITIAFYFYKTAFWPLTYLFVASYFILVVIFLFKSNFELGLLKFSQTFRFPLILAIVFIVCAIINGNLSNSLVAKDILLITVLFSLFYFLYFNENVFKKRLPLNFLINLLIITTTVISIFNILNIFNLSIVSAGLLSNLNISGGSTIANDYNFFSLFILFGLVILNFKSKNQNYLLGYPKWVVYLLNLIFFINIILSGSRRGMAILLVLLIAQLTYLIVNEGRNFDLNRLLKKFITALIIVAILFIVALTIYRKIPKQRLSVAVYRYAMMIGITNYNSIERILWENIDGIPQNKKYLIDENSFTAGYNYWSNSPTVGTIITNVSTPYGEGVKMIRNGPKIDFSLLYTGPKIIYYAKHTYRISFKIKFLNGDFSSFNVGWWVDDGGKGYSNTLVLDKKTELIGDGWYNCSSEYTFIDNQTGLIGFINSVDDKTECIISDFELLDLNYVPELPRFEFEYKEKGNLKTWLDKIKLTLE